MDMAGVAAAVRGRSGRARTTRALRLRSSTRRTRDQVGADLQLTRRPWKLPPGLDVKPLEGPKWLLMSGLVVPKTGTPSVRASRCIVRCPVGADAVLHAINCISGQQGPRVVPMTVALGPG